MHPPSITLKLLIGLGFLTLSFFILYISVSTMSPSGLISPYWIIAAYLVLALGELCFSPISLSMVTKFIPARYAGLMMGILFVSAGIGGELAGVIAKLSDIPKTIHQSIGIDHIYATAFSRYGVVAAITTLILLLLMPILRHLTKHSK